MEVDNADTFSEIRVFFPKSKKTRSKSIYQDNYSYKNKTQISLLSLHTTSIAFL